MLNLQFRDYFILLIKYVLLFLIIILPFDLDISKDLEDPDIIF